MRQEFVCPSCGQKFKAETIDECPGCAAYSASLQTRSTYLGAGTDSASDSQEAKKASSEPNKAKVERIEPEPLKETTNAGLIAAQNRTTHAIRALAVFFFTSLRTAVLGSSLIGLGFFFLPNPSANGLGLFLVFAGWLTAFIGFFYAVDSGMTELLKSKVV